MPTAPLYQQGWNPLIHRRRFRHSISAPNTPLYQLGMGYMGNPAAVVGVVSSAGGKLLPTLLPAASWAGPVGLAVVAIGTIIAGLLAKHELRKKQATDENSAMNIGVQGFDSDLKTIQAAYKAGQIDAAGAIQGVQTALQGYWTVTVPHIQPGRNGCNGGSSCPGPAPAGKNPCTGNIGATCCVGCFDLAATLTVADGILPAIQGISTNPAGKYVGRVAAVSASKYGGLARAEYTLDWTPPPPSAAASAVSSIESALTGGGSGGSGSLLPILAIAAAFFLLK